jgi:hypothetical protein
MPVIATVNSNDRNNPEKRRRNDQRKSAKLVYMTTLRHKNLNKMRRDQIVAANAQYEGEGSLEINSVNYSRPEV